MSTFTATFFLTPHANARGTGAPNPVLYVMPDGGHSGNVGFQINDSMPLADRVQIAESLLRGAQEFRDAIVVDAERRRTAEDELAEARAEIARLQGEADGAS